MSNRVLVYSSEAGRICPDCKKPIASCICKQKARAEGDGNVRVRRETKGRGGKTVTTVTGVPGDDAALDVLAKRLKARCGTGGTIKDGIIEIQGDHRDAVLAELLKAGLEAKIAGG